MSVTTTGWLQTIKAQLCKHHPGYRHRHELGIVNINGIGGRIGWMCLSCGDVKIEFDNE